MMRGIRRVFALGVVACAVALSAAGRSQQRDVPAGTIRQGTGQINGVVVGPDADARPIRRAIVTLTSEGPARSVVTDDDGRFSFGRLAGGRYTVTVRKAAYLPAAYGATKPGRQGTAIPLADGERMSIRIAIARGGVISGMIRDQSGAAAPGVVVYAVDARAPAGLESASAAAEQTTTDDRGLYRFFGLMPSEYLIGAVPTVTGSGMIGARSTRDVDALLAKLAQRAQGPNATPAVDAPQAAPIVGFAPVYYPGASLVAEAARVPLAAGEERVGIDFQIMPVAVTSISGTITGDVPNLAAVQLMLVPGEPRMGSLISGALGIVGTPPDAEGKFTYANMPPGHYRIVARGRRGAVDVTAAPPGAVSTAGRGGGGMAPASTAASGDMLYGVADVDARGQDLQGLSITLQPGGTVSGRLVIDAGTGIAPPDVTRFQMVLRQPGGSYMSSSSGVSVGNAIQGPGSATVQANGAFEIAGVGPTVYNLSCQIPPELSAVWKLRSAVVDGRDLLDSSFEAGPGVTLRNVVVTVSDKRTLLNGTLQTPSGQPASDFFVIVFSTDRTMWRAGARRLQSARPGTDGRFSFADLPAGEYFIAALTDLDPGSWQDPEFLTQVLPAALKIVLAEGETKTQDLRISGR